jgi:hypothetical protein
MSLHLQKFVDRVRGFEARGGKDFVMPMADAKGVSADITQLLLELRTYQEQAIAAKQEEVIQIKVDGGGFK